MTKLSSQPELESIPEVTALNSILANKFNDFSILFWFFGVNSLCVTFFYQMKSFLGCNRITKL